MTVIKLQQSKELRRAAEAVRKDIAESPGKSHWISEIAKFIEWFRNASDQERASVEFQRKLWDENPVAAIGQGRIDVSLVLEDQDFRNWLVTELSRDFGEDAAARRKHIDALAKRLRGKLGETLPRIPQAKMFRVFAIAFPYDFTTIVDGRRIKGLYREVFGGRAKRPVVANMEIMDRLTEVLGPPGDKPLELANRMAVPWELYEKYILSTDEEATEESVGADGETKLIPLPAARRRRSLTIIANGLQSVLGALDFVEDGVGKDELMGHLRTLLPNYKDSSLNVVIGVLTSELGVVKRENGLFVLTDRGEALLETQDPSELSDWLLTRVLGLDMALVVLRDNGPQPKSALFSKIRSCNPAWTSDFSPSALLSWLRSFGVTEDVEGEVRLTEVGQQWADRIHWKPPVLMVDPVESPAAKADLPEPPSASIKLPEIDELIAAVQKKGRFSSGIIRNLHAGLWSDKQRHFAVLSGLSGTGKTLLARAYGAALRPNDNGVFQLAVQPGWYDSGAILGYVNPLRPDAYTRTGFLEFLMQAVDNPSLPHVAILDEMNLSHPEQYLAPILSAMESAGGTIHLHQEGDDFDGVPQRLPYPSNLILIGTVNMDETTHGLSDKLLDRAFTLEFWDVDIDAFRDWKKSELHSNVIDQARTLLKDLYAVLRPGRMHFGYRTIADVVGFLSASGTPNSASEIAKNLDSIVYAKVLPKLRGDDSHRFRSALTDAQTVLTRHGLTRSAERVKELNDDLISMGTARFWR